MRHPIRAFALATSMVLLAAACGGGGGTSGGNQPSSQTPAGGLQRGGVFRIGLASDVHEGLDPQREYYTIGWEFLKGALMRLLVAFNMEGPNEGGNDLVPDLATELPTVSADGLTWTFHIKPNIHYAPPLQDVSVTAGDFRVPMATSTTVPPPSLGDTDSPAPSRSARSRMISMP